MIYAATGHRPEVLGGYQVFPRLVDYAVSVISTFDSTRMVSGMALGWDLAVAKACTILGVPFIAAVPFVGQENIWPRESKALYHELLYQASEVVIVCTSGYAGWKFIARDKFMVDHADAVLALWSGQKHGGTHQCVQYAVKMNKPVHNVWDGWMEKLNAA